MEVKPLPGLDWGCEIRGIQLATATREELLRIGSLTLKNLVVVLREQPLSNDRELEICESIGSVEHVKELHRCPTSNDGTRLLTGIQRVTGLRHPDGKPMGLFGHDHDLDWHANRPSAEMERKPLIWLRSLFGSQGTRTSWANCARAYANLPAGFRDELEPLYGIFGFEPGRYTTWNEWKAHRNWDGIKIVRPLPDGEAKGLFFPFLQLFGFKDRDDEYSARLIERLKAEVLRPENVYHHDWQDGDVVISEQWHTIHKRWACDVSNRMLHRISLGHDHVGTNP